ncbi:hypothetical protein PP176A_0960 [Sporanaerobacter sp. PP17-6a]|nr:hypothetical protein PP176A_0960 [Sporanaerobacter sp. PP17-6a]
MIFFWVFDIRIIKKIAEVVENTLFFCQLPNIVVAQCVIIYYLEKKILKDKNITYFLKVKKTGTSHSQDLSEFLCLVSVKDEDNMF